MPFSPTRYAASLLIAGTSLLCAFTSVAQAGTWGTVAYNTDGRTSEFGPDINTDRADGGGGGRAANGQGPPIDGGQFVTATMHATFTYTCTTGQNMTTDPPPADVYVLEYGQASYGEQGVAGPFDPHFNRVAPPSSSAHDAVYSPRSQRHKGARVWQVQVAPGGGGAANDGWGDGEVMEGTLHVSKGYHLEVYQPAQATTTTATLTVTGRALSASLTGTGVLTSVGYNAQIVTIDITRNGHPVTSPQYPETPVMVGEPNAMNVAITGLPTNVPPATYLWDIPGEKIKEYTTTGKVAQPNHVPPIAAETFTGHKVQLSAADLTRVDPHFYWYNGSFTGDSREVSVVVTIAGKPITVKAKLKVYKPKRNSFLGTFVVPQGVHAADPAVGEDDNGFLRIGPHTEGVSFVASVENPNVPPAKGEIALEQVMSTLDVKYKGTKDGIPFYKGKKVSGPNPAGPPPLVLDSADDDPIYGTNTLDPAGGEFDTHRTIESGATATTSGSDSPDFRAGDTSVDHVDLKESFVMYLAYRSSTPGSIWVIIGKVSWEWSVQAERTGTGPWNVTSYTPLTTGTVPGKTGDDTDYELPEWDTRSQDVPETTIPAW